MRHAILFKWGLWLAVGMAGAWPVAAAIPETPRLRILDVEDGLPSSNINGIAQDRSGYLWLATTDGLARYDGVGMRVWRHVPGDPAALPGNYITAVHVDGRDRVWVAVEGLGLSVMDGRREGFRHYRKAGRPQIGSDDVWAIASDDDAVWFGTFGGGLHRLDAGGADAGGAAITRYMPEPDNPRSLPADTVLSLEFDAAGQLWIGTTEGLARWNGGDGGAHPFERIAVPGSEPAPMVYSVTADGAALWVGAGTGAFKRESDGRWQVPAWSAMFASPNAIFDVITDDDGQHWLASQRNLWRVAPGGVPAPVAIGTHGPVRPMFQMLRQADGGMWFPVSGSGLGYLRPDWRRIAQFSREQSGLGSELYRDVIPAREGGMWLIGGRGEVERLGGDGVVHPLDRRSQARVEGLPLMSGAQDRQGRLWIGERRSLIRLDLRFDPTGDSGTFRQWREDDARDGTLAGAIALLAFAPDGTLWLSSSGAGLQQRDPDSGRVLRTILPGPAQGLGVGDIEALGFDDAGRLWVADEQGLQHWDAHAQKLVPARGIERGGRAFGFAFDGDDALWLQRLSGLEQYRRSAGQWRLVDRVGVQEGIPAVEGSDLLVDRRHQVWLSTLRGLYRWDPRRRHVRRFGVEDGLSSQEFVKRAMALTAQGQLAAAVADGGVVMVDTLSPEPVSARPSLFWDRLEVRRDGRWVALPAPWTVASEDRELRVQLRLLAFDAPASNRYYTRLEGYDRDWVAQGGSGERVFAGLPAGRYILRARATDALGNAAVEQVMCFSVQPPWWRTWWTLTGVVVVLMLLGGWGIAAWRDRVARHRAQQRVEHEREVAQQSSLAKSRFLATLGHEVRTPMTGVLGMSELLLGTPLDARQRGYTQSIRHAGEHLLRLVNDALDLARIESGRLELADEPFDLHALVDEAVALTAPLARQRGLAFVSDLAAQVPRGVRGDAKRICQILLNLLGNAIKFTEHGQVSLRVAKGDGDIVRFEVRDTGPGLDAVQKARLFRRFEQAEGARTASRYGGSGLGLAICQELAVAMGGRIVVDSTPGEGTVFMVELPLPRADVATVAPAAASVAAPRRLLLVEDDPSVVEVVAGLLRAQGHHITHAGHGLAALADVATTRFDAALLDLDLPGIDGFALARQLRLLGFDRPLIALTARADPEAEPLSRAAGFDHFLRKPVTGAMLAALIDAVAPDSNVPD